MLNTQHAILKRAAPFRALCSRTNSYHFSMSVCLPLNCLFALNDVRFAGGSTVSSGRERILIRSWEFELFSKSCGSVVERPVAPVLAKIRNSDTHQKYLNKKYEGVSTSAFRNVNLNLNSMVSWPFFGRQKLIAPRTQILGLARVHVFGRDFVRSPVSRQKMRWTRVSTAKSFSDSIPRLKNAGIISCEWCRIERNFASLVHQQTSGLCNLQK